MIFRTENGVAVPQANMSDNITVEANQISAVDTKGLLGTVGANSNTQILIDEIADRVISKLATKTELSTLSATVGEKFNTSDIVNVQTDSTSKVPSAALVKSMDDSISQLNSQITIEVQSYDGWSLFDVPSIKLAILILNNAKVGQYSVVLYSNSVRIPEIYRPSNPESVKSTSVYILADDLKMYNGVITINTLGQVVSYKDGNSNNNGTGDGSSVCSVVYWKYDD